MAASQEEEQRRRERDARRSRGQVSGGRGAELMRTHDTYQLWIIVTTACLYVYTTLSNTMYSLRVRYLYSNTFPAAIIIERRPATDGLGR